MSARDHSALHAQAAQWPSLNRTAAPLAESLVHDAKLLRLGVARSAQGCTIVDAGIRHPGGIEAGRRIAEICLGGLGRVQVQGGEGPLWVHVHTSNPVLACLGSQYAGWSLSHGSGKGAFHALGSGPARALASKEELFGELGYRDQANSSALVLEVDQAPPPEIEEKVQRDCGIAAERLIFILTPTRSLAGMVQIVARSLEVALHKAHALGFPLQHIVDGAGSAPLPPPAADFLEAMGRSNDAILFGAQVQLFVDCSDGEARELAQKLPSLSSRDYGKRFAKIFKDYEYDFYKIDPMLFAPARVTVNVLKSGASFSGGKFNPELLKASFGEQA
ncbi:MAG: methenyltetrahydromethanopterin cyclohydrolase [Burkholderiales bacterium]